MLIKNRKRVFYGYESPEIGVSLCTKFQYINYLAHAYLSFNDPDILTGNMISDFVKGKKQYDYPPRVQKGITLHRAIDTFTDTHPSTRAAMECFRPHYRLYAGAFVDVVYDHFLANDPDIFAEEAQLQTFATRTYRLLQENKALLPDKFAVMLPYMVQQDWLTNYRYTWGMKKSFGGVVRRAAYLEESDTAFNLFSQHYALLQQCYKHFFPALKNFSVHHMQELINR